jgi:general secretion pathway protein D
MISTTLKFRRTSKLKLLFLLTVSVGFFNNYPDVQNNNSVGLLEKISQDPTDELLKNEAPSSSKPDVSNEIENLKKISQAPTEELERKVLELPEKFSDLVKEKNENYYAQPSDFAKASTDRSPKSAVYPELVEGADTAETTKSKQQVDDAIEPKYDLNFENASVRNVLDYVQGLYNITFFSDDQVLSEKNPRGVGNLKVTFKTNKPISKKEILDFVDLILELADLARIQMTGVKDTFRITNIANANKSNLPTYIGIDFNDLPDQGRIRYVYFFENRPVNQLAEIIRKLQSRTGQINTFPDSNAMMFADDASNIKYLMHVIKIMDSKDLPEVLSILKLKNADAGDVAKLYETLKGKDDIFNPFVEKKGPKLTQTLKIITEPRMNALILFGPRDQVQQIEKFIIEHVDIELQDIPAKIFTHKLNYSPAEQVAKILSAVVAYGAETEAAKLGGIKAGEKYLSNMSFEADKQGNILIIRGSLEDYNLIKPSIEELDRPQKQVAVEVLLVAMSMEDSRNLQNQIRNKNPGKLDFQLLNQLTPTVVTDAGRLTGNLLNSVTNGDFAGTGWNLFSLGKSDAWSLMDVLQFPTRANTLAHPFLVATNKYTATVSIGTKRNVVIGNITSNGANTSENDFVEASTTVKVTPQINSFGVITLDIDILIEQFTAPPPSPNRSIQKIRTNTSVAENEIIALGGIIDKQRTNDEVGLPILARIPILGSLFRGKITDLSTDCLMVFLCPKIINPHVKLLTPFTQTKLDDVKDLMTQMDSYENPRDPISRWFFKEPHTEMTKMVDDFAYKNIEKTKEITTKNP